MAHELDMTRGQAAMLYRRAGGTPWHDLGVEIGDEFLSVPRAMEISGTDFNVELRPMTFERPAGDDDTVTVPVPDAFAVVRADTWGVLGTVGKRYTVLQNRDAFGVLEPLIDNGLASIETMGSLRDGADVWGLVRFNIDDPIVREVFADEVVPYGLISNNHNGNRAVVLQETPIRVVCANTLGFALGRKGDRAIKIAHTLNVASRTVEAAEELWAGLIERMRLAAVQYRALRETHLSREAFERVVLDVAAPLPTDAEAPRYKVARDRAEARRADLSALWVRGKGHKGDRSAWEAYNGAVESIDHNATLWPLRGQSNRVSALMSGGSLSNVKDAVLASVVEHVQSEAPHAF